MQVFRGVQVDESQLNQQMKSESNYSKSSKTSAKSKLPKNYFAINELLERSQKL